MPGKSRYRRLIHYDRSEAARAHASVPGSLSDRWPEEYRWAVPTLVERMFHPLGRLPPMPPCTTPAYTLFSSRLHSLMSGVPTYVVADAAHALAISWLHGGGIGG